MNSSQKSAVSCITNAVLQPYASSKICLLQGPPGTGKSLTTIALIENILAQVACAVDILHCIEIVNICTDCASVRQKKLVSDLHYVEGCYKNTSVIPTRLK